MSRILDLEDDDLIYEKDLYDSYQDEKDGIIGLEAIEEQLSLFDWAGWIERNYNGK